MLFTYPASLAQLRHARSLLSRRPRSKDCGGDEVGNAPSPIGKRFRIDEKHIR